MSVPPSSERPIGTVEFNQDEYTVSTKSTDKTKDALTLKKVDEFMDAAFMVGMPLTGEVKIPLSDKELVIVHIEEKKR